MRPTPRRAGRSCAAALLAAPLLMLAACGDDDDGGAAAATDPKLACTALAGQQVAASTIGLPSGAAAIESAAVVDAVPQSVNAANNTLVPATPEYCKVLGSIAPADPAAPKINFQVNLPTTTWNRKAMQFGGGGFNGTLVTGLGAAPVAPSDAPLPINRGYATFGTDSGHQNAPGVAVQAFALNEEALVNFAYASYKKVRDVATETMRRYYGSNPQRTYYVGSSEGGREGLAMAQRFPADYDGIYSQVPVINWVGLQTAGNRSGIVQQNGGWLPPAKVTLLNNAVLAACDRLDNLADNIVSAYERCGAAFDPATLRCANGADTGNTCLSDAQIAAVNTLHAPTRFGFALANGVTAYPGWGYGGEDQPGGFGQWVTGTSAATFPPASTNGLQWQFGSGAMRYFIVRDPNFDTRNFDPNAHVARMQQVSALMDATNPDLSAFFARGGKLLVKENMADYAQSPFAGIDYYKSVVARLGQAAVDQSMRLYVTPGANHGGTGTGVPGQVDMVAVLEDWVERGQAPGDLVNTLRNPAPPFAVVATRPMCRYPLHPRYNGTGDPAQAASFTCAAQ